MVESLCQEPRQAWKCPDKPLQNLPIPESTWEGEPPTDIDPNFCKLYGYPLQGKAEYYRGQCSSLEEPDTHSNSSEEWVHSEPEWFIPHESLACYTGYDD